MVEAIAATPSWPRPAQISPARPVQRPERVAVAVWLKPAYEGQLSAVPSFSAVGSQLSMLRARERPDTSVVVLLAWGIEVTAEQAGNPGGIREVGVDGLVGANLGEVRPERQLACSG